MSGEWTTANLSSITDGASIRERIFRAFAIDPSRLDDYILLRKEFTSDGSGRLMPELIQ